jgi:Transposase IS200 like
MARKLRVEYPGAIYHVMNRGDRREPIFRDDEDRQRFTAALEEACAKTAWQVEALCLMSNQMGEKAGPWHYGEAVQEAAEAKAERIVKAELAKRKWDEQVLAGRRKGDPVKVAMAQRLRRETTVPLAWIADWLQRGAKTHLAHLLYWSKRDEK